MRKFFVNDKMLAKGSDYMARLSEQQKRAIGKRIKKIRQKLQLDQAEFGKKISPQASASNVSRWERGLNTPDKNRLKSIAKMGNTSIEFLKHGLNSEAFHSLNEVYDNLKFQTTDVLSEMTFDELKGLDLGNLSNLETLILGNFITTFNTLKNIKNAEEREKAEDAFNSALIELDNISGTEGDPIFDFNKQFMETSNSLNYVIYQLLDYRQTIQARETL
ncbi:hypothetical protein DQM16_09250 [Levilactobacillus brevis]|nr:hypothetical protein DQM16_09250 [Levilactobacillus brevis]